MVRNILLVINGTDFGGTESVLFDTACRLRHRGRNVHVVSLKPIGRIGRQLISAGVAVESLEMRESVHPAALIAGCCRLARRLRQHRPDIVHSFMPRANVMSRIALKLARLRTPHVSGEHSTDVNRRGAVSLLNRHTARWTTRILAVSPQVRTMLVGRDGLPPDRVAVLENGIDSVRIDATAATDVRAELGLEPDQITLCSAGRLVRDKGHLYLIRAMSRMCAPTPLLIVGEGPEEERLRAEVAAHGLSRRVHFLGYRADLIGIFKAVDALVLPSLEEGVPMVILEAMACALPVVASDVGGIRMLVSPGQTGILVPPAEAWTLTRDRGVASHRESDGIVRLAEALDQIVSQPTMRAEMGRLARRRVEQQFTLDGIIDRLEAVYGEVAAGADRTGAALVRVRDDRLSA